ncbi:MAG: ATP-binding cassette domain-containing protein [Solirubrobacterales bacterium]
MAGQSQAIGFEQAEVFRWNPQVKERTVLLHPTDWQVERGEHWVVLGPNGAGKTTLLHMAGAITHPSAGAVEVLGNRLGAVDMRRLRERIGFVDARTARSFKNRDTAIEVVMTGAHSTIAFLKDRCTPEDRERAKDLLAMLGARSVTERQFGDCSQGERQRVLIARALMPEPELLLLDEATTGLDFPSREQLLRGLDSMSRESSDLTSVSVTHHLEEIPPTATHALLLAPKEAIAQGPVEEVLTDEALSACFGVPVRSGRSEGRWFAGVDWDG